MKTPTLPCSTNDSMGILYDRGEYFISTLNNVDKPNVDK